VLDSVLSRAVECAHHAPPWSVLPVAPVLLVAITLPGLTTQEKRGSPEEHLPSNVTQLMAFGERAS
jgi:hypothetical protein